MRCDIVTKNCCNNVVSFPVFGKLVYSAHADRLVCMHVYFIDHSPLRLFRAIVKQTTQQIKNANWQEEEQWVAYKRKRGLEPEPITWNKSSC